MKEMLFEWDDTKAKLNIAKHQISFEEASSVFDDELGILFDDPDHSDNEDRFIILGESSKANLLIVCHCYRGEDNIIRIISARKATRSESEQYVELNNGW